MDPKQLHGIVLALIVLVLASFMAGCGCPYCNWYSTAVNTGIDVGTMMVADRSLYNVADDYATKSEITGALFDEALLLNVNTDVYQGMVMLTGIVEDPDAKVKAEKLARRVTGVREVFNEIQVSTAGGIRTSVSDLVIENKLNAYLFLTPGVSSVNFRWRAVNGIVFFMGIAQSRKELDKILSLARVSGVRKIVTHIFLSDQVVVEGIPTSPTAEIEVTSTKPSEDRDKTAARPSKKPSRIGTEEKREKPLPGPYGGVPPEMPTYYDRSVDELH